LEPGVHPPFCISAKQGKAKVNLLVKALPHNLPVLLRRPILQVLFKATADAFGCPAPKAAHLSFDEYLRNYALFTSEQAEKALQSGCDVQVIKTRLFQNAFRLGGRMPMCPITRRMAEVLKVGQLLYRAIGIEIQGNTQGDITVQRCYFRPFYSSPVCQLMSALDDGVFAGLSGTGRLVFSERMTEGRECCRAKLFFRKEPER